MAEIPEFFPIANDMYEAATRYERGPVRNYLGMSQIGKGCERSLWYSFRKFSTPPIDGRLKMIFSMGDRVEEEIVKWLNMAGYTVTEQQRDFNAIDGFFRGHWDGQVAGITSEPHVLEIKSANSRRFKAYKAEGVQKISPEYYCQIQCYMGYSGLKRGIFVIMNKDNCELYTERIPFVKDHFELIEERARKIIYSNDPLAKSEGEHCKWCGFHSLCTEGSSIQTNRTCGTCSQCYCDGSQFICLDTGKQLKNLNEPCDNWRYRYENK